VEKVYECGECGTKFCEECGEVERRLCYDCLEWDSELEDEWEEEELN